MHRSYIIATCIWSYAVKTLIFFTYQHSGLFKVKLAVTEIKFYFYYSIHSVCQCVFIRFFSINLS